jgi:large subunit ribosomal protein L18
MIKNIDRESKRKKIHWRIKKRVEGTNERPRLSVHRSHKNLYLQLVNDIENKTLFAVSTQSKDFKSVSKKGGNLDASKKLGALAAKLLQEKGFNKIVFDRGGYLYHGRIKTLADALREGGIQF